MKIKKGTVLNVLHSHRGRFEAIADQDFDSKESEMIPLVVNKAFVESAGCKWKAGDQMPCRSSRVKIKIKSTKK